MAISNQLTITFNHDLINKEYDFYLLTTSDKYISSGAYILDKPIEQFKAESIVFDSGRNLFVMFKKGIISRLKFVEGIQEQNITIKQVLSTDIKDYILFRLFLFSINNFEYDENKFNNLAGKLYITKPKWMSNNRKTFKALSINVDVNMYITANAVTFSSIECFNSKKILSNYPRYIFSNKNGTLKRTFEIEGYIKRSAYGKKAEIPFLSFDPKHPQDNKVQYLYKSLDLLKKKFNEFVLFEFVCFDIKHTICRFRDDDFIRRAYSIVKYNNINLIDWSNAIEYADEFNIVKEFLSSKGFSVSTETNSINKHSFNLVYLHNKEYYEQNKYNDPYKKFTKDTVIQHFTIEDTLEKLIDDNEAIFNTILKEMVIKDDIINQKRISLDDWFTFMHEGRFIFGKEDEGRLYFMIINPDGSFEMKSKVNDFSTFNDEVLDKCSDYLTLNKGKEKTIVADEKGNIIVISRTNRYVLPSKDIFDLDSVSRDKEARKRFFDGVVDINLFDIDGITYYNAGLKGSGMKYQIPKASIIYKVDVVERENFISDILETMSVPFVKYNSFTIMPYPIKYLNEYIALCKK